MGLDPDDPRPVALAAWCRTQLVLYDGTDDPKAERMRRALETGDDSGHTRWGVGIDPNTITASLRAVLNAFERHQASHKN